MYKVLLRKYFQNRCSRDELITVLNWFKKHADSKEGKALLFEIWEEQKNDAGGYNVDFDLLLDRIHHQMNLDSWRAVKNSNIAGRRNFIVILRNIAAILLLPVAAVAFFMSEKYNAVIEEMKSPETAYNEVFSSVDAITKVTLPDGSNVWLNHSSSLRYPATFRHDFRTVELAGEGYFEVAHNPEIPFLVSVAGIEVVAVGTTFNILAYQDESKVETSLINGKVILRRNTPDHKPGSDIEMKPAEMVVYDRSNEKFLMRNISDDRYFSWKDGKLVFNEEPMDEVVRKLSRWFNVEISVQDPELNELTFTGTFVNETLYEVMELISMITPATYSISARKETGTGTFSKRKVTLFSKKNQVNP